MCPMRSAPLPHHLIDESLDRLLGQLLVVDIQFDRVLPELVHSPVDLQMELAALLDGIVVVVGHLVIQTVLVMVDLGVVVVVRVIVVVMVVVVIVHDHSPACLLYSCWSLNSSMDSSYLAENSLSILSTA